MESWQNVSNWYSNIVGEKGHYYHQSTVIPNSLKLLNLSKHDSLLDLACGQGVLARHLDSQIKYVGLDSSAALIANAKKLDKNNLHHFEVSDASSPLNFHEKFSAVSIILALQNIKDTFAVLKNASKNLQKGGKLLIVINHPAFRIPRHTSWLNDLRNNVQSRVVNRYMSRLEIPILANPSKKENSAITYSYHLPISELSDMLYKNGFAILKIEEWVSDKNSVGKHAKAENTARSEIPMFMAILAQLQK